MNSEDSLQKLKGIYGPLGMLTCSLGETQTSSTGAEDAACRARFVRNHISHQGPGGGGLKKVMTA